MSNAQYDRFGAALDAIAQPQIVRVAERQLVVCVAGTKFCGVDLGTGKEAWPPLELGFAPDRGPQLFTLVANGEPAAMFVSRPPNQSTVKVTLTAISLADRRTLWQTAIDGIQRPQFQLGDAPLATREFEIENLGPNGRPAIVAAAWHIGAAFEVQNGWTHYDGRLDLSVLDPATGKPRWERSLTRFFGSGVRPKIRWLVGPDLDGDGEREIFAAWSAANRSGGWDLIVAALAGRDGQTLWRWTLEGGGNTDDPQPALRWWHVSESGWPQLIVPVAHAPGGQPITYILDSANGRLKQTLSGVANPRTCDLNGDGLEDLLYTVAPQGFARLMAVRGEPPISLRWLDSRPRLVAQDFYGDGIDDFIVPDFGPVYSDMAVSGRDGRILWKIALEMSNSSRPVSAPLPLGDLAGDGRPAVVAFTRQEHDPASTNYTDVATVAAFSGRDGHRLWPSNRGAAQVLFYNGASSGSSNGRSYNYPALGLAKLDPREPADVFVSVPDSLDATSKQAGNNLSKVWLNVVSGESGKLSWRAAVALGQFGDNGRIYRTDFQDLNGDGVADVVAWVLAPGAKPGVINLELKAFSGADGSPLWPDAPPILGPDYNGGFMQSPAVGDLDGNGAADVLFTRQGPWDGTANGERNELVVVGGRDGRVKWTWPWVGHSAGIPQP